MNYIITSSFKIEKFPTSAKRNKFELNTILNNYTVLQKYAFLILM